MYYVLRIVRRVADHTRCVYLWHCHSSDLAAGSCRRYLIDFEIYGHLTLNRHRLSIQRIGFG